jgi:hypothetical protein
MPMWIRQHLLPATHANIPLQTEHITGLSMSQNAQKLTVIAAPNVSG